MAAAAGGHWLFALGGDAGTGATNRVAEQGRRLRQRRTFRPVAQPPLPVAEPLDGNQHHPVDHQAPPSTSLSDEPLVSCDPSAYPFR